MKVPQLSFLAQRGICLFCSSPQSRSLAPLGMTSLGPFRQPANLSAPLQSEDEKLLPPPMRDGVTTQRFLALPLRAQLIPGYTQWSKTSLIPLPRRAQVDVLGQDFVTFLREDEGAFDDMA